MLLALVRLLEITVVLWIVAEIVLQVRQYRQGGQAETVEWRSLGVIVLGIVVGNILASIVKTNVPVFELGIPYITLFCIALPIMWCGIAFRLYAMHTLGKYFRGVVHVQEGHEVIRKGPYRLIRHPSYSGALVALVGVALTFNNILAIIVFIACGFASMYYRIVVEERVLSAGLGAAYTEYAPETKRLIPKVW